MPAESLIDHHDLALPATLLPTLRAFAPLRCPEPPTHYELRGKVALTRHSGLVPDREGGIESARIKLDPQTVEAIARRAVELLEARGLSRRQLVDAAELARRLGIERSWIYTHAIELGAVKLGDGPKPRLRFDPEVAARVLRRVGESAAADPPARSGKRAGQPQASGGSGVRLLPIKGPGDNESPPAA